MGVLFFCLAFFCLVTDRQAPPVYFFSSDCGPLRPRQRRLEFSRGFMVFEK